MSLLLLLACTGPDEVFEETGAPVDTADPVVECPEVSLSLVQEWQQEDPIIGGWGASAGDLDADGDLDIVVAHRRGLQVLENDGSGGFALSETVTGEGAGLPPGISVALVDLDDDGHLDMFVGTDDTRSDQLLMGQGGMVFSPVQLPNSEGFTGTGTFADFDGDGRLDLFVARRQPAAQTIEEIITDLPEGYASSLYLQLTAGEFTDASDRLPEAIHPAYTQEAGVIDVEGDGDLDLYLANDFGPFIVPNQLLLNDGSGNFSLAEDCYCEQQMYGMAAAAGDVNRDGLPDLWITDIGSPDLLLNAGDGSFYDATAAQSAALPGTDDQLISWGTLITDVNLDGYADMPTVFGYIAEVQRDSIDELDPSWSFSETQRDTLLLGGPDGFTDAGAATGFSSGDNHRALIRADFDGDGRDELFTAGDTSSQLWDISGGCTTSLRITADAGPGNRPGIGTRAEVWVNGERSVHWLLPGGIGSQSEPVIVVGLGGAEVADEVVLVWPDGEVEVLEDVPAGSLTMRR